MSILPIYNCFHPVLKQSTQAIEEFNQELVDLVKNMFDTLYNISNGVGLAANQVGVSKSVFIVDLRNEDKSKPLTFINPEIISFSDDLVEYQEGCLSIPEFYENLKRPSKVEIKFYDLNIKEHKMEFDEFMSRVIQHEKDHLDGILMFERLTPLKRTLSKTKLSKIQKGEFEVNYPMIQPDGKLYLPEVK